jgi:hypothetical protein
MIVAGGFMSEGGKLDRPPETVAAGRDAATETTTMGGTPAGSGMTGVQRERTEAHDGLRWRLTGGAAGSPPGARIAAARRAIVGQAASRILRKSAGGAAARPAIPSGGGAPLSAEIRQRMEPRLGADLSAARLHTGAASAEAATGLGARAFTVGTDVHFNASEFAPGTKEGDRLLAHELTHVVQASRSGVQRKAEDPAAHGEDALSDGAAAVSDPTEPAEREADAVADAAADHLHGGDKGGADAAPVEKAPQIGAKLAAPKVFRALAFGSATYLSPTNPLVQTMFPALFGIEGTVNGILGPANFVDVVEGSPPQGGIAGYDPALEKVTIQPLPPPRAGQPDPRTTLTGDQVSTRAAALSHELQHVHDAWQRSDPALRAGVRNRGTPANWEQAIHSEWLSYARQALTAHQTRRNGQPVAQPHLDLLNNWGPNTFKAPGRPQTMFSNTGSYIMRYEVPQRTAFPTDAEVTDFITRHQNWVDEAFAICPADPKARP